MIGPHRMFPTHRNVIKRRCHKSAIRRYLADDIEWDHSALTPLRNSLRVALRRQQEGLCFYCRQRLRLERRNAYENIEHYLDKGKHRKWTFSPVNLVMACTACNMEKGSKDLGYGVKFRALNSSSGPFGWLHPYFDDYHQNIRIRPGYIYSVRDDAPKRKEALKMIADLKLDRIERVQTSRQTFLRNCCRFNVLIGKAIAAGKNARAQKLIVAQHRHLLTGWYQ